MSMMEIYDVMSTQCSCDPPGHRKKVLIVDDDECHQKLITYHLRSFNTEIYSAFDGFEAISMAAKIPDLNLILMDIKMPNLNGIDATIEIKKNRAKARDEMQPHLDKASSIKVRVVSLKEKLKTIKKAKAKDSVIRELEEKIRVQEKAVREEEAIASDIDAKVFDLKAVNPNALVKVDKRTPMEIIENIEKHGKLVEDAIKNLKSILKNQERPL